MTETDTPIFNADFFNRTVEGPSQQFCFIGCGILLAGLVVMTHGVAIAVFMGLCFGLAAYGFYLSIKKDQESLRDRVGNTITFPAAVIRRVLETWDRVRSGKGFFEEREEQEPAPKQVQQKRVSRQVTPPEPRKLVLGTPYFKQTDGIPI